MGELSFGALVTKLREARGWSMEELGRRAHVSGSHIKKIERGDRANPTIEVAAKIAKAFGVPLVEMLNVHFEQSQSIPDLPDVRVERLCREILEKVNRLLGEPPGEAPIEIDLPPDVPPGAATKRGRSPQRQSPPGSSRKNRRAAEGL